jgi:hypothetical protein
MTKQQDKQELAVFLPIVIAVTVAIGGESLLAYSFGEVHALQGIAVGSLCGLLLLSRQVITLEREVRKLRQSDSKTTV